MHVSVLGAVLNCTQTCERYRCFPFRITTAASVSSVSPTSEALSPEICRLGRSCRACAVCGDSPAKVHYGVLACFGCKGFFRRAVKDGRNKYQCRYERNCPVNKYERNSCRYCRFRKCLQSGMNPDAVRPDRGEAGNESGTGKALPIPKQKLKSNLSKKKSLGRTASLMNGGGDADDWTKLLGPEQRNLLLDLMRLSKNVADLEGTAFDNVADFSLKSLIADRSLGSGMCSAALPSTSSDTAFTAIGRVVSVVDWVDGLVKIFELGRSKVCITVEDKACMVQDSFAQLTLLSLIAHVAAQPSLNDLHAVRALVESVNLHYPVKDLVRRLSAELVSPIRYACLSDTDFVLLRAIIALNPDSPGLCVAAVSRLRELRASLFDLLIKSIKRSRPKTTVSPSAIFGQLLSLLPPLKHIAGDLTAYLSTEYGRPLHSSPSAFTRILTDIFSPEPNDLVLEAVMEHKCKSEASLTPFNLPPSPQSMPSMPTIMVSAPSLIDDRCMQQLTTGPPQCPPSAFTQLSPVSPSLLSPPYAGAIRPISNVNYNPFMQFSTPPSSAFLAPTSTVMQTSPISRPNSLTFSSKLPLQLTKSIEEILRPAGMAEDPSIINRPLSSDWADGAGMSTPIFNRDVVAQFFPEMAGHMT